MFEGPSKRRENVPKPVIQEDTRRQSASRAESSGASMSIEDKMKEAMQNTRSSTARRVTVHAEPKTQTDRDREYVNSLGLDLQKWEDVKKLKEMGFGVRRLLNLGVEPELIIGDWWITRLFTGKFSEEEVNSAVHSVSERKASGATVEQLLKEGYSQEEIFKSGCFTWEEIKNAGITRLNLAVGNAPHATEPIIQSEVPHPSRVGTPIPASSSSSSSTSVVSNTSNNSTTIEAPHATGPTTPVVPPPSIKYA